jgi:tetratricopeptide (TPR) repeat protein
MVAAVGSLAVIAAAAVAFDWWRALPTGLKAQYVGREACVKCHAKQCDAWAGSDHDRAMDPATPQFVLGDFNDRELEHFGVTSRMSHKGDKFYVATDNREGRMETFEVKYVLGVRPLQQYLVEFPDGRIQCLPVAWDTAGKRWFHLYPKEPIPHTDELHWTRPLQNWNYMCAECHTTNLQKNYHPADNTYHTAWSEIDVSCETCHGPGSIHVQLAEARKLFWDRRYGYGLARLKDANSRVEIESCAPCHARRRHVAEGFRPGEKLLDYYLVEMLDTEMYHPDGQIRDEDYEYGSFVQSRMYHKNVRCSNCHDPHTLRVKFPDNRLCGQCHLPTKYDTEQHHHHPSPKGRPADQLTHALAKTGTMCVDCHMPVTNYMVVDPRRDHSLRIPRPELTVDLKIPNACNACHHDEAKGQTPQWALEQVRKWYGEPRGPKHFAYAIDAGRRHVPDADRDLQELVHRKDLPAIVRASAIVLASQYESGSAEAAVWEGIADPEEIVRAAAARSLYFLPVEARYARLSPLLSDPVRSVRTEAARALTAAPAGLFTPKDRSAFDAAMSEYMACQEFLGDQPAAHLNKAVVHTDQQHPNDALTEYLTALRIDPAFIPGRVNLAMLYDQLGKKKEAEQEFREVIRLAPKLGEAYYSLGLLIAEDETRLDEAAKLLATACDQLPQNPRIHYNRGLAEQKLGHAKEAEASLVRATQLAPGQADYLHALAVFYSQQKSWRKSLACAAELIRLAPQNPQWRQFEGMLREEAKREGGLKIEN